MIGFDPSTTLTDILQSIIKAGPFGMVSFIRRVHTFDGKHGAIVQFNCERAARRLEVAARDGRFRVDDRKPFVLRTISVVSFDEVFDPSASPVLRLTSDPNVKGFNENDMRAILKRDPDVVDFIKKLPGKLAWGFDREPAQESIAPDGSGRKVIEWPFYSNEYQAQPFLIALQKHFGTQLQIDYELDPHGTSNEKYDRARPAQHL